MMNNQISRFSNHSKGMILLPVLFIIALLAMIAKISIEFARDQQQLQYQFKNNRQLFYHNDFQRLAWIKRLKNEAEALKNYSQSSNTTQFTLCLSPAHQLKSSIDLLAQSPTTCTASADQDQTQLWLSIDMIDQQTMQVEMTWFSADVTTATADRLTACFKKNFIDFNQCIQPIPLLYNIQHDLLLLDLTTEPATLLKQFWQPLE